MTGLKFSVAQAHISLLCDFTLLEKTCGKSTQTPPNENFVGEEHGFKAACEQSAALLYILPCLHVLGSLVLQADCLKSPCSLAAHNPLPDKNQQEASAALGSAVDSEQPRGSRASLLLGCLFILLDIFLCGESVPCYSGHRALHISYVFNCLWIKVGIFPCQ